MQLRTSTKAREARHARPALRLGARRPAMLALCVGLLGASAGSAVAAPAQGSAADLTDGIAQIVAQAPAQSSAAAAPIRPAAAYATASSAAALQAKSALHVKNQQNKAAQAKAQRAAKAKDAKAAVASARGEQASRSTARVSGSPRAVGRALVAQRGWGAEQFACLDKLWTKESNWQVSANNPSSSAYGIPQSLPGSKMSSHGSDWRTNPATQIAWGLDYIDDRYGSPCSAWAHSQANNWY